MEFFIWLLFCLNKINKWPFGKKKIYRKGVIRVKIITKKVSIQDTPRPWWRWLLVGRWLLDKSNIISIQFSVFSYLMLFLSLLFWFFNFVFDSLIEFDRLTAKWLNFKHTATLMSCLFVSFLFGSVFFSFLFFYLVSFVFSVSFFYRMFFSRIDSEFVWADAFWFGWSTFEHFISITHWMKGDI